MKNTTELKLTFESCVVIEGFIHPVLGVWSLKTKFRSIFWRSMIFFVSVCALVFSLPHVQTKLDDSFQ